MDDLHSPSTKPESFELAFQSALFLELEDFDQRVEWSTDGQRADGLSPPPTDDRQERLGLRTASVRDGNGDASDSERRSSSSPPALPRCPSPRLIPLLALGRVDEGEECGAFDLLPTPPHSPADQSSLLASRAGEWTCPPAPRLRPRELPGVPSGEGVVLPETPPTEERYVEVYFARAVIFSTATELTSSSRHLRRLLLPDVDATEGCVERPAWVRVG